MDIRAHLGLPNPHKSLVQSDIMQVTNPLHMNNQDKKEISDSPAANFADALNNALGKVNDQQVYAERLQQQMITDPDSVEAHTVLIAAEKARMAITFTKTLADMAVRTYRDLVNLR